VPRTRHDVVYDAPVATIREFFERSMQAREDQRDASTFISALNTQMEAAGVSAGVLSKIRKLAALPPGKRGREVALLRWYLDVFEDMLADPQINIHDLIREAKQSSIIQ
jgi:hypothetical protein